MAFNAVPELSNTQKESSSSLLSNNYLTLIRISFLTKIGVVQKVANLPLYPVLQPMMISTAVPMRLKENLSAKLA